MVKRAQAKKMKKARNKKRAVNLMLASFLAGSIAIPMTIALADELTPQPAVSIKNETSAKQLETTTSLEQPLVEADNWVLIDGFWYDNGDLRTPPMVDLALTFIDQDTEEVLGTDSFSKQSTVRDFKYDLTTAGIDTSQYGILTDTKYADYLTPIWLDLDGDGVEENTYTFSGISLSYQDFVAAKDGSGFFASLFQLKNVW